MSKNLPETVQTSTPVAIGGQAALFSDPSRLLDLSDADLRNLAAEVGREAGSVFAQVRRAAGLVAWAGWYRFSEADYGPFAAGLAKALGIEVDTLRRWRRKVVATEHLAVPALVDQRAAESKTGAQKRRSGAVRGTTIPPTPSIPAASTEAPAKKSEGDTSRTSRAQSTDPSGQSSEGARVTPPPTGKGASSAPSLAPSGPSPEQLCSGPGGVVAPAGATPPERQPSQRQVAASIAKSILTAEEGYGAKWTPEEATAVRQRIQRELNVWREANKVPSDVPVFSHATSDIVPPMRRLGTRPDRAANGSRKRHADDCSCLGCKPAKVAK